MDAHKEFQNQPVPKTYSAGFNDDPKLSYNKWNQKIMPF